MAIRKHNTARWGGVTLCILFAAGCATDGGMQSTMRHITPSFMLSEQDRAERDLKDPGRLHLKYGHFQETIGDSAEARKSYEAALKEDPKSVEAVLGLARLDQLGDRPKEAEAGFQRALKLKPGDAAVLAASGQFYSSQKRWAEAVQSLDAAVAAAPKEAAYQQALAVARTRSGDVNAGLALFTKLVGPDKAHYNVAFLLKKDGQTQAAAEQCRLALATNPNFEPARALLGQLHAQNIATDAPNQGHDRIARTASTALPSPTNADFPEFVPESPHPRSPAQSPSTGNAAASPFSDVSFDSTTPSKPAASAAPTAPSSKPTEPWPPASLAAPTNAP